MEGIVLLSAFSVAMFFGCYIAGLIPLVMSFSERKLRVVTVLGAGLLVGTALSVIIPEGVQSLVQAQTDLHNTLYHSAAFGSRNTEVHVISKRHDSELFANNQQQSLDSNPVDKFVPKRSIVDPHSHIAPIDSANKPIPYAGNNNKLKSRTAKEVDNPKKSNHNEPNKDEHGPAPDHEHEDHAGHGHSHLHLHNPELLHVGMDSLIGISLVLGFVFMLIVDQISRRSRHRNDTLLQQRRYDVTATIGLVVHAAADGIALGAASTTKHLEIQFIVFAAIMLHKAPAAFGLVVFLLHAGLEKKRIRRHLLLFASAAPICAILTYAGIRSVNSESLSSLNTTGILMLFSAGTFLYVATVHVLPEIVSGGVGHSHGGGQIPPPISPGIPNTGTANIGIDVQHSGFTAVELTALVIGALCPSLLALGHSH